MHQPPRILIVDDTAATRYATCRVLRAAGFAIIEASTGEEALLRSEESIDLVLLDVQLPDIHGFEVCRRLRERGDTALLPVVHLSATFRSDTDRAEGLDAGADGYLTHPVEPIVLIATVKTLLRARRAEDEQRNSQEQIHELFEASPIGMALLDEEGKFLQANPEMCSLLAKERDDLVGAALHDFVSNERRHVVEQMLVKGKEARGSVALVRSDGSKAEVELRIKALPHSAARIAMATDVTQQRRYEVEREQLLSRERFARGEAERLSRLKDQFIAMLGHELRNPLASIVTGTELLKTGSIAVDKQAWILDSISRESEHLRSLINDLLDTTRISHGKLTLNKQLVGVSTLVDRAVSSCRDMVDEADHELTTSVDPPDLMIFADPLRIEQVIVNLLTNAAKYTPASGQIRVEAWRSSDDLEIVVSDTGVGLTEQDTREIFDAFTQIGAPGQGLGIGLTLVRQLIELHGGTIEAESEGPGKGARFCIKMPLGTIQSEQVLSDSPNEAAGSPLRILVVDDNESAAQMLQMLLQKDGHETAIATTGLAALEAARIFEPELVLLDIALPDIGGREVADRIRQSDGNKPLIAALSGYGQDSSGDSEDKVRFDAYLVKPANIAQVRELAESIVARRSRVR